ncbi:hypothetical protein RN001_003786 [Aquatica leii]|uniref:HTH psq-type domain-containing protein n=1 Tax=Aquatica leii TaxID=1421715 RepID=A0AAN7PFM6_9COLE|nr:hypothetical protein RN001_003786 [Aquatica leii]
MTIDQFENPMWLIMRKHRLTASNFGRIIKAAKSSKFPPSLFKSLTGSYNLNGIKQIQYGRNNEKNALEKFETQFNLKINKTGLHLHPCGYLGASPDGLAGNHNIESDDEDIDENDLDTRDMPSDVAGELEIRVAENSDSESSDVEEEPLPIRSRTLDLPKWKKADDVFLNTEPINCINLSHTPPVLLPKIVRIQETESTIATPPGFSPEIVRPFPKAAQRKTRGSRTKKSTIYTDTPENEAVRKKHEDKERRLKAKQIMVRTYVRKTDRQGWSEESMRQAIDEVLQKRMGLRKTALEYHVPQSTLERKVKRFREAEAADTPPPVKCTAETTDKPMTPLEDTTNTINYVPTSNTPPSSSTNNPSSSNYKRLVVNAETSKPSSNTDLAKRIIVSNKEKFNPESPSSLGCSSWNKESNGEARSTTFLISPEQILPIPHVGNTNKTRKFRKRGKTAILTVSLQK